MAKAAQFRHLLLTGKGPALPAVPKTESAS
mgnify:CR=1 FL=1